MNMIVDSLGLDVVVVVANNRGVLAHALKAEKLFEHTTTTIVFVTTGVLDDYFIVTMVRALSVAIFDELNKFLFLFGAECAEYVVISIT